ncbi:hypothetical protein ACGF13_25850 [Kitasatospora sp. NPDC048286]|uniref:hypothetical protein n=1 Tax=Kitasatospora sp. NPDC048286 TaxID=3364047 RepID=UPI0037224069
MTIERPEGAGDPEYRFNLSGMGPAKRAMDRLGMLSHGHEPLPWPRIEDFGLTAADFAAERAGEVSPAVLAFRAASRAVSDWQAERPTGIPDYKIGGTNDGWLVTPAEIRAALAALAAQPASARAGTFARTPRWEGWVDYLTRAAAHGGFRVE